MQRRTWLILGALGLFLLSSCAPFKSAGPPGLEKGEADSPGSQRGWWYVRFQIYWPENEDPKWHTDLILAHKVLSPVIAQHRETIGLWRFHRRAQRDQAGHQFSFVFYSSPQIARQIFDQLDSDPFLEEMKAGGVLNQVLYDDTTFVAKPRLEDTSDRRWSPPVQRSWPYYIMGVSEMWLHMIQEIVGLLPPEMEPQTLEGHLSFYKKVEESVTEEWQKEGRHAYLHHLNAMFGYEPLRDSDGSRIKF